MLTLFLHEPKVSRLLKKKPGGLKGGTTPWRNCPSDFSRKIERPQVAPEGIEGSRSTCQISGPCPPDPLKAAIRANKNAKKAM